MDLHQGEGLNRSSLPADTAGLIARNFPINHYAPNSADPFVVEGFPEAAHRFAALERRSQTREDVARAQPATFIPPVGKASFAMELAGLDLLSEQTLKLLAAHVEGRLDTQGSRELASNLAFPGSREGASLFSRHLSQTISDQEMQRLLACARCPWNERGARLSADHFTGQRKLSNSEELELFSLLAAPYAPKRAAGIKAYLQEHLASLKGNNVGTPERLAALGSFISDALQRGLRRLPDQATAARWFGVELSQLDEYLSSDKSALPEAERRAWQRQLLRDATQDEKRLDYLKRRAARSLVLIENELHRCGLSEEVTTDSSLQRMFGLNDAELSRAMSSLSNSEYQRRQEALQHDTSAVRLAGMLDQVREELDALHRGAQVELSSEWELGREHGLLPIAVFHQLRAALLPAEWEKRREYFVLSGRNDNLLSDLPAFVRAELEACGRREITRISSDAELAALFGVSEDAVQTRLRSQQSALRQFEQEQRETILHQQKPQSALARSLYQARLHAVRDRLGRHLGVLARDVMPEASEGQARDSAVKVSYRGHEFASLGEAVCGLMLEKYLEHLSFRIRDGESFQIPLGNSVADYFLRTAYGGLFIEYHPIVFKRYGKKSGTFSQEEYRMFIEMGAELEPGERQSFLLQVQQDLAARYLATRERVVAESGAYAGSQVRVVQDDRDLYYLLKNELGAAVPDLEIFERDVRRMRRMLRKEGRKVGGKAASQAA